MVLGLNSEKKAEYVRLHAAICLPCPVPLETRKPGEWRTEMREVFDQD